MKNEASERLLKNYYNSRKSWEAWCYLNNIDLKNSKPEIRKYVDENELLYYLRYLALKDVHIELYKILKNSKNTVDNIFMLLNQNPQTKAKEHLLKLNEFETEIKSLTNARDKFYAHLDSDYKDFLSNFEIESYYTIFELIEEAIFILGKENELLELLKEIPSRDEFYINKN
ncbi:MULTISPECIES: hypothetical protein [Flavobacterium]|uniref:hypothetical protein n=1 Tax=Flavobacterium TaxID=237 RepID=UPI001FCB45AD|nr:MULTISPECIES: hypothetical protein [Flavobacterium]UOK42209.1 hypothetical protein LZF87_12930 [Flavobacterium enshiense]